MSERFYYKGEDLFLARSSQDLELKKFADGHEQAFYLYDLEPFEERAHHYISCFGPEARIPYAMKANSHPEILKRARDLGLGVDLVSGGELQKALNAGFSREQMIFSGVGKSKKDLELALQDPISQINVESPMELDRIGEIAKSLKKCAT